MIELSLHILDIAQNSVHAGATVVEISIDEKTADDLLCIRIADNGRGMDAGTLKRVTDPYYTTGNKKTGLGIPLFKQQCEQTGGKFTLESEPGIGTKLEACFGYRHIDRQPMGDIAGTFAGLVRSFPDMDWTYTHGIDGESFQIDTREIRDTLGAEIALSHPEVVRYIRDAIRENISALSEDKE